MYGYASIMHGDASIMHGDASIMYGYASIMYGMPVSCVVMPVSCMVMPVSCVEEESSARVHIYKKVAPRFVKNAVFKPPERNIEMYLKCLQKYRVWMLTRVIGSSETKQISPVFAGFISSIMYGIYLVHGREVPM